MTQAELDSCIGPAVYAGLAILQMLVDHGANVNQGNKQAGRTPLHHAAARGYLDIAEFLIAKSADVNAVDHDGSTPLDQAFVMPIEQQFLAYAGYSTQSRDRDEDRGRVAVSQLLKSRGGRRGRVKAPEGLLFQLRLARPTASEEELTRQYIVQLIDSNINPFMGMLSSIFEQESKRYPELVALARDCFGQDNVPG